MYCYYNRYIRAISVRRRKKFQTPSREQIGAVKKRNEFQAHWSCPLSMSCVCKDRRFVQSVSNNEATREAAEE